MPADDIFDRLMDQIHDRVRTMPEGSYTTKLVGGGTTKMGAKILEEVLETTLAAGEDGDEGRRHLVQEAGDVLYHLWVLLGSRGIRVDEIRAELERREGTSGIEEKNRRTEGKSA
jgi:phosphoribosyl-ATP pyrophosphohydrolase